MTNELIINEELIETLTLAGAMELHSTSHRRGRDTIERLSLTKYSMTNTWCLHSVYIEKEET
jgi:hypothetical protein